MAVVRFRAWAVGRFVPVRFLVVMRLRVLGFDVDDPLPQLTQYVKQMQMNYPVLIGEGHEDVLEAFGPMVGLPTTVIIGRDGRICSSHTGLTDKATFEEAIKALL